MKYLCKNGHALRVEVIMTYSVTFIQVGEAGRFTTDKEVRDKEIDISCTELCRRNEITGKLNFDPEVLREVRARFNDPTK